MSEEIEFKFRVASKADLDAIIEASEGQVEGRAQQENHFFDSEDQRLNRNKFILRLRNEDGDWTLTAKGPSSASADGTLTRKAEEELSVSAADAEGLLQSACCPLATLRASAETDSRRRLADAIDDALAGAKLGYIGAFKNERCRVQVELPLEGQSTTANLTLECDTTEFPGGVVQHEMEVEVEADQGELAGQALRQLMERAGVQGQSAPSKSKRFFAALEGRGL